MNVRLLSILFLLMILAGCSPAPQSAPPMDAAAIRTEAVRTAVAEMTAQAILHPPTEAATATIAPMPEATATPQPNAAENSDTEGLVSKDAPGELIFACEIDQARSLPPDGPQPADASQEKTWLVRNSGSAPWTSQTVRLKWVGGMRLCPDDRQAWMGKVMPGETVLLSVKMQMPAEATDKPQIVEWGLVNPQNEIFCKLYYQIPYIY